jgi:protein-ribulosamine 3-kinase
MHSSQNHKQHMQLAVAQVFGHEIDLLDMARIGGGSINKTYKLTLSTGCVFVKMNGADWAKDMFLKEVLGLNSLRDHCSLTIPQVLGKTEVGQESYLFLEYMEPVSKSSSYWQDLGEGLAELHKTSAEIFGLDYDNYIGSLNQSNTSTSLWHDFFINSRLLPMVKLAIDNGSLSVNEAQQFDQLFVKIYDLVPIEPPALIHGDLWRGNIHQNGSGAPVLLDPAIYFGHREMDLSFSLLFGGFDEVFYQSYNEAYPLAPGFRSRQSLHNLYPLLVHLNLFGRAYWPQIQDTLRRFT